jgi:LacI family transcriptional regulator
MGKTQQPTIYDVAQHAGVSISTVSRVLNAPHRVRRTTREKVFEVIDELEFIPRVDARDRARRGIGRIGVLAPYMFYPSFGQRFRGVAKALADESYELIIYSVDSKARLDGYLAMLPISHRIEGLIIMSLPVEDRAAERLLKAGLETVIIEYCHPNFSSIEIDDFSGGQLAATYLLNEDYKRLAYIGDAEMTEYSLRPGQSRLAGFRQTLEEHGLPLGDEYVKLIALPNANVGEELNTLIDLPRPPEAIFASTDELAMHVLKTARERGLEVPDELAVIGFDDLDHADFIGLTTVHQPLDESGQMAAEELLARLANPSRPVRHIRLPLRIVERETV